LVDENEQWLHNCSVIWTFCFCYSYFTLCEKLWLVSKWTKQTFEWWRQDISYLILFLKLSNSVHVQLRIISCRSYQPFYFLEKSSSCSCKFVSWSCFLEIILSLVFFYLIKLLPLCRKEVVSHPRVHWDGLLTRILALLKHWYKKLMQKVQHCRGLVGWWVDQILKFPEYFLSLHKLNVLVIVWNVASFCLFSTALPVAWSGQRVEEACSWNHCQPGKLTLPPSMPLLIFYMIPRGFIDQP